MFKYDIRKRREELNLSLQDVANIVGVAKVTVMKWEKGGIENMRRDRIALLAQALHISPEEFMGWDNRPDSVRLIELPSNVTASDIELFHAYLKAKESDKTIVRDLVRTIDKVLDKGERTDD